MLTATVGGLLPPAIARLPFVAGHPPAIALVAIAFLLAGPAYDVIALRRVHLAYLASIPAAILATPPVASALSSTEAWRHVARLLIG
jgi:hypothetical protein